MKEKKKSQDWYIAATHYLTAGFAMPFIIGLVVMLLVNVGLLSFLSTPSLSKLFLLMVRILAIWLGTMYSANYLKNKYIIGDKDKIVNLATMYFVVLNLGYLLIVIFSSGGLIGEKLAGINVVYSFFEFVVAAFLFYIFSKKYIKNTEAEAGIN